MTAPPTLLELRGEALARADELLDRANHDVAKYMAMTARNVDAASLEGELAAMLRRDLEETFDGQPAWSLWAEASRSLAALAQDPELGAIDEAMSALEALFQRWREGERASAGQLLEGVLEASDRIRRLRLAVRRRRIELERPPL